MKIIGRVGGEGPKIVQPEAKVPVWGNRVERLQERRQMTFRIKLDTFPPELVAAMFGEQAALAMQFGSLYRPLWFLGGEA
ncbi:hypothetical protein SEA_OMNICRITICAL_66 [Mycobacterium phage OmniCritical]|nr:hypothetical protein SEA_OMNICRITICAL_66 [Mycobacterium phage OmniCritical]